MRAIARLGLGGLFCALSAALLWALGMLISVLLTHRALQPAPVHPVMRNVLANALRLAPEGTAIEIDAQDLGADGCEWSVRDHGPGIPEAERRTIFEAFVQSSRTRSGAGGTGLGLTICHRIMRAHGGRIEAYNAPDGGAVFQLWLPARHLPPAVHRSTVTADLEALTAPGV